ncbi:hypothetical protein D3C72_2045510 [compost metagenome]
MAVLRVAHPDAMRLQFVEEQIEADADRLGLDRLDSQWTNGREGRCRQQGADESKAGE